MCGISYAVCLSQAPGSGAGNGERMSADVDVEEGSGGEIAEAGATQRAAAGVRQQRVDGVMQDPGVLKPDMENVQLQGCH